MKKTILAITISALLVGCGTRTIVVQATVPEAISPATVPTAAFGDDAYISNIVANYPHLLNNLGRPWLVGYAKLTCSDIDKGTTITKMIEIFNELDLDMGTMLYLTGEAIRNFCPHNQWFIDSALAESNA